MTCKLAVSIQKGRVLPEAVAGLMTAELVALSLAAWAEANGATIRVDQVYNHTTSENVGDAVVLQGPGWTAIVRGNRVQVTSAILAREAIDQLSDQIRQLVDALGVRIVNEAILAALAARGMKATSDRVTVDLAGQRLGGTMISIQF